MRSDCQEVPEPFTKADADKAETMEARLTMARVAAGCQVYWPAPYEVCGLIKDKYNSLGGPNSFLKFPISNELTNPGNTGKRSEFMVGPIYWSAATGAHPVVNSFMTKWGSKGWEGGFLRYPTTDEIVLADGIGRRQEFQGGSVYWHPVFAVNAAVVGGAIRDRWRATGSEQGKFGYPVSDEIAPPAALTQAGTLLNFFQAGAIVWDPQRGTADGMWFPTPEPIPASDDTVPIVPGPAPQAPCPVEAVHPRTPHNCEFVFPDAYGHQVLIRYGRTDADAERHNNDPNREGGRVGAFGWMHGLLDHGMDYEAMGSIINVARKVPISTLR